MGQIVSMLGFVGDMACDASIQLCSCSVKTAMTLYQWMDIIHSNETLLHKYVSWAIVASHLFKQILIE